MPPSSVALPLTSANSGVPATVARASGWPGPPVKRTRAIATAAAAASRGTESRRPAPAAPGSDGGGLNLGQDPVEEIVGRPRPGDPRLDGSHRGPVLLELRGGRGVLPDELGDVRRLVRGKGAERLAGEQIAIRVVHPVSVSKA